MQTSIFQENPDYCNLDRYLASWLPEFPWLVRQHADAIQKGDRVFIWRAAGSKKSIAGIVAETVFTGGPEPRLG